MELTVSGELEVTNKPSPWVGIGVEDLQKGIERISLDIVGLEKIEIRFDQDFERVIVWIELSDEKGDRKVTVSFWNDAAEKLMSAFKTIVDSVEWEDAKFPLYFCRR